MTQRRTIAVQRRALVDDLRRACREGELRPGDMLPTMRELQEKYRLSPRTVSVELKKLVAEGVLRTVSRVGIFVAEPASVDASAYLMVTPSPGMPSMVPHTERVRLGFEERVTELGGSSLCLSVDVAACHHDDGSLPPVAGVLLASADPQVHAPFLDPSTPLVRLSPKPDEEPSPDAIVDTVHMDNVDGGRRATRHLVQHGHRRIAFLGLHPAGGESVYTRWSALRERGWRDVMAQFGESSESLLFQPVGDPGGYDDEVEAALSAARAIVPRRDVSAVVCANDHAVMGLLEALRAAGVPGEAWPSLVGFDGLEETRSYVLTSMRLPWEDIGRQAAQLLSDRANGRLEGPPQHHELPMKLVSRFGPQKDWSSSATESLVKGMQGLRSVTSPRSSSQ